ncbi:MULTISPECIES: flagellar basal-body MS-ring/collar protein FliF [Comamonas]|uniref:flagellar basal-body MS-ring/collar protein FliF n=1 Tax=Comamonas TaxID=283 RepID=UPI00050F39CA|nr:MULTISPECIES: flagellar basal-body MS-ring/collar protein FliF [Comamonas]KGG94064.1 flagellar M-ring protein FliF [Comamonas thiooxydans]KGH01230.1 flagellar M-ring protein FliF [Comamonas thiooxydans]KGH06734.1 flagellar M-ring protein FliF [Comamonas thiooxydans]KGH14877.1 flagellar M-ring protein FliF [Comamonas thiooxydans]TZG09961.1 flagellar basal body M-ring protein FliF [Comamonas thiooxydans]
MSAVAEVPVPNAAPGATYAPRPALAQRWNALDRGQRLRWGALAALVAVGLVAAAVFYRQPDYKLLFSNVSDKDGGAIVAQLTQMNVPYKYSEGGGAILIPADRVHDVRLKLATQGLPKGSVTGFELMENSKFGITQFQERLNFQRGLEGELTRSILALNAVQSARVHLALPNQNGFFREQQKPSASVLLSLHPGRMLDRAQIAGIVHLVASSVPEMEPAAVSVVDDTGKLLSQSPDGNAGGVDMQQFLYTQQVEQQYVRRILDILEPVVGKNNVKAQVSAELDFSQTESTSEQHRPNQSADGGAVRSQQVMETNGEKTATPPTGVPGATSNQPPQNSTAPINGANPAPQAAGAGAGQGNGQGNKRESITNYEVDKTVRVTRGSTGTVKRLTAAVVVNAPLAAAAGTDAATAATAAAVSSGLRPLTAQQQEQLLTLVRETVGYSADRGDSVNLVSAPFMDSGAAPVELPMWKDPEIQAMAKSLGVPIALALFGALVLLGLVRPLLKGRNTGPGGQLNAIEAEALDRPALPAPAKELSPTKEQERLDQARHLAKQNPIAVANIVKTWINGEG